MAAAVAAAVATAGDFAGATSAENRRSHLLERHSNVAFFFCAAARDGGTAAICRKQVRWTRTAAIGDEARH
jgi:hypothetical protein